jgi:NADPH:quinone reductase-like Zn-dependent oxidoreductase
VPETGPEEILIRVESAGVGVWDPFEREGGFAEMLGIEPTFPYVLGSDGAGAVVAVGDNVDRFNPGDRVYACSLANPKGGFYAEYAAVTAANAAHIPEPLSTEEAGTAMVDGLTALNGLDDVIGLKEGETLLVFGASGGVGHLAVQLAKRMGARVFAVASGQDGVELVRRLGADEAVNGRRDDVLVAAKRFSPDGLDAALLAAGGDVAEHSLEAVRDHGRVAYPNGVHPEPEGRTSLNVHGYDGRPRPDAIEQLNRLINAGPFTVHVSRTFNLDQAAEAQEALGGHFLGKLALIP